MTKFYNEKVIKWYTVKDESWQNDKQVKWLECVTTCRCNGEWLSREYWRGKYHCTIDLLFDWFGLVSFVNKNKNCQLLYSWFQTSQTGCQLYSDTSPFSIPWIKLSWHNDKLVKWQAVKDKSWQNDKQVKCQFDEMTWHHNFYTTNEPEAWK